MRITSAGNVGMTDSPSTMLEVRNSTGLAKIKIRGDDGATSTRAELHIDRTDDVRGGGVRIESSGGALNQWFIGSPYNGGSSSSGFSIGSHATEPEYIANSHLFINSSGQIGIGENSPSHILHIDAGSTSGKARLESDATDYTAWLIANNGGGKALTYYDATDGNFAGGDYGVGQTDGGYMEYSIGTNSPKLYHVFTGGNVGIGNTNPTENFM